MNFKLINYENSLHQSYHLPIFIIMLNYTTNDLYLGLLLYVYFSVFYELIAEICKDL